MPQYIIMDIELKVIAKNRWLAWYYAVHNLGFKNPIIRNYEREVLN